MRHLLCTATLAVFIPVIGLAQSIGLLVGNEDYDLLPEVDGADRVSRAVASLADAGMQVDYLPDVDQIRLTEALEAFGQRVPQAREILVVLSGRFIQSETETYFLPVDADVGPSITLHLRALPLSTVFAVLAEKPGKSILVLASDDRRDGLDRNLSYGLGTLDIPQGVTVIAGSPRRTTDLIQRHISQPGRPFVGAARQGRVRIDGYMPDTLVFLDGRTPPPQTRGTRADEIRQWRAAVDANTVEAYEGYLADYPNGTFTEMAENRMAALVDTPEARAERAEQSLDLNRNARRDIQRDLSLLGFNTRGIDGIFGRGTRAAIAEWQRSERFEPSGYLTRDQIEQLNEQAARRATELEEEAEARRQQQLADDLAFWNETGSTGGEAGLRAYLERFPDGEFAELANERLRIVEEQKRERAGRLDRQLWDEATARDTAAAYERYLVESPSGAFREEAQARIVALQRENEFTEAARAEQAMNMSSNTRQLIEARLNGLGLRPGTVDGTFDEETRRAIRRYQSARRLPQTGYVSDALMVQLMADTVRQIFR
ncbi:MAG: peptidoglycan-binding domain-containing protein [Pseudomonadota bacterium]